MFITLNCVIMTIGKAVKLTGRGEVQWNRIKMFPNNQRLFIVAVRIIRMRANEKGVNVSSLSSAPTATLTNLLFRYIHILYKHDSMLNGKHCVTYHDESKAEKQNKKCCGSFIIQNVRIFVSLSV